MKIKISGPDPWSDAQPGVVRRGIGTVFPAHRTLITLPGIHASQRLAFLDHLHSQRIAEGKPALSAAEAEEVLAASVDLFFEGDQVLIRPDPANMPLAFAADEALQALVSKQRIKFLHVTNKQVLQAIKAQGECWRICPLPQSLAEIQQMIRDSRTAIAGEAIYYHNRLTGSRFLTCEAFRNLGQLAPEALVRHLHEIKEFVSRPNRLGQPEIAFFQAGAFGAEAFNAYDFAHLDPAALQAAFEDVAARFTAAVPLDLRQDDVDSGPWCKALFTALIGQRDETVADEILQGLSPEYFMQLEWLPGCRIEGGELLFDSIFDECQQDPRRLAHLCDSRVKSFIFNFVRHYGQLEYVNVARVSTSLSRRAEAGSWRGVYLAEIKVRDQPQPVVRIIRMQKWDVAWRLDHGRDLLGALLEASDYTDYVLDRRLACRQLGMNLPPRIRMHRLREVYDGENERHRGQVVWLTYFERDFCPGIATDKIAPGKLEDPAYALRLARLLGKSAAPNLIVGRQDTSFRVLFDDGDEILLEENGLPVEILVADATGAFADYTHAFDHFAAHYAQPINKRQPHLKQPGEFADAYLEALRAEFERIQEEYRRRRRAFDSLFQHYQLDPKGNLAFRWKKVLERLDQTDAAALIEAIRAQISCGPGGTEP